MKPGSPKTGSLKIGGWLPPALFAFWAAACAPARNTSERPEITEDIKGVLAEVYLASLKSDKVYDPAPCKDRKESECRVLKFHYLGDILSEGERKAVLETDTLNKVQWIAVQGTNGLVDAGVDGDFGMVWDQELGMDVHRGFLDAATKLNSRLEKHLKPGYIIKLTGHSLGGAMAVIVADQLALRKHKVESCLTFGQPKVTNKAGTAAASDSMRKVRYIRVVNQDDIVPNVPPVDNLLFYRNLLDAPLLFGRESWNGSSKSMYHHFGRELPLGEGGIGKYIRNHPTRNAWLTPVEYLGSQFNDHHMYNYVAHVEDMLRQAGMDSILVPRCQGRAIAYCREPWQTTDFGIRRGRRDTYFVAAKSRTEKSIGFSVTSLDENGDRARVMARDTLTTDTKPKEEAVVLRPAGSILGGGGWVRFDFEDGTGFDSVPFRQIRQFRRALPQHTLEFRLGWQGGRRDWWPPSMEWYLLASSFWKDWLRGGAEFGLTSIQPWDAPAWRELIQEGSGPFDPFKDGGRYFQARFIAQAYPVPASSWPSFLAGLEWVSLPGGGAQGVRLYPNVFAKTQVDIPGWRGYSLGLLRGGLVYESLLASEVPAGKGDYAADFLLETEIGSPLVGGLSIYPVLRLVSDTPLWRKDFGPSLFTASLLLNVNLQAVGRIFGLTL